MKDKNESDRLLRTCEFIINLLLALALFYAFVSIQELKKEVEYLVNQNAESRYKITELEEWIFFKNESSSQRILNKREIHFNGDETLKQLTNEDRLAKALEELQKNETHVSLQTMKAITISSFERLKESEIQMEKPLSRNATTHGLHTTSEATDGRRTAKEKPSKKKFHTVVSAQEPAKENRYREGNRLFAIHYSASLANHSLRHHPLHKGNGLITLPSPLYQYWIPVSWTEDLGMSDNFYLNGSDIKVNRSGLYLIYSQIQYLTTGKKDDNGYKIFRNSEPIAQCIFTKTVSHDKPSPHTCSLTTVASLSSNDKIFLRDISHKPTVALSPEKSFLGLILITPT